MNKEIKIFDDKIAELKKQQEKTIKEDNLIYEDTIKRHTQAFKEQIEALNKKKKIYLAELATKIRGLKNENSKGS